MDNCLQKPNKPNQYYVSYYWQRMKFDIAHFYFLGNDSTCAKSLGLQEILCDLIRLWVWKVYNYYQFTQLIWRGMDKEYHSNNNDKAWFKHKIHSNFHLFYFLFCFINPISLSLHCLIRYQTLPLNFCIQRMTDSRWCRLERLKQVRGGYLKNKKQTCTVKRIISAYNFCLFV